VIEIFRWIITASRKCFYYIEWHFATCFGTETHDEANKTQKKLLYKLHNTISQYSCMQLGSQMSQISWKYMINGNYVA
jgi:hypothetical protein